MMPTLNMNEKYRSIQCSTRGSLYIQGGHVFDEGAKFIGPSPEWGEHLFQDANGEGKDCYAEVLNYAKKHKAKQEAATKVQESVVPNASPVEVAENIDDVFDAPIESEKEPKRKPGRPKKVADGAGHDSEPF